MREEEFIRQRYSTIFSAVATILIISGLITIIPITVLLAYPEEFSDAWAFLLPAAGMILLGIAMKRRFPEIAEISLTLQEGGIAVVLGWTLVIIFSAWPFIAISGLSFSRALFESVSGWTTTGLSVVDVSKANHLVLFWRSLIQLAGGAGLAIIMMSAIVGPVGTGISNAEGRGDQLLPHVKASARLVLAIYACYAIIGALSYYYAGMTAFDAINHSFAAVSTGGFSTKAESIAFWDSAKIEGITIVLMILGNLSFVTAWYLWKGEIRVVLRNCEIRTMAFLMPLSAAAAFYFTCQSLYPALEKSARVAIFETVSALTTTGFSTVLYTTWNAFGILLLTILMIIGGGTCSTAGGMKQFRVFLAFKLIIWEIQRFVMPAMAVHKFSFWEGQRETIINDARIRQIAVFIFTYLIIYAFGVMVLCASGFSLADSAFEFASALGTAGISIGVTTANMPDIALWAEIAAMFLGRLEFMIVFVSLIKTSHDFGLIFKARNDKKHPVSIPEAQ